MTTGADHPGGAGASTLRAPAVAGPPAAAAPSPGARRAGTVLESVPLATVLALVALMVEREGGFDGTVWYPVALFLLGLAVAVGLGAWRLVRATPATVLAAVAALALSSAWSFATIGWAAVRGAAWDGSNRGLLYLLAFALLACFPLRAASVWPALLAAGVAVAVEGVATAEHAVTHPGADLIGNRLSEPLGYPNATAALFMIFAWVEIGLASRPWLPAPARALAFGLAGLHLTLNLLAESRGSVFTLPLVAAAYVLLVPGRLRSLATLALVALGVLPVLRPVLDVYGAEPARLGSVLRRAVDLGLVWAALLALAGAVFAAADARIRVPPRLARGIGVALAAAALAAAAGLVAGLEPWRYADSAWHSFKSPAEPSGTASHFGGLGSNRYDFWRVGLIEFARHPVAGIGTDNFLVPYLQLRRSDEEPLYPHSLAIRILSQTGAVGAALFVAFLALAVAAVVRIRSRRERELAGVLATGAAVFFLHGLVDWLWEMPVLGVLGLALLGTACGLAPRRPAPGGSARRAATAAAAAAAALLAAGAGATLVLPWLAERDVARATAIWRQSPAAAFSLLDRAGRLDPLSDEPELVAGAIASRLHRYATMRAQFAAAVARSPDDWYAQLELGIAASLTGDRRLAAASLARAVALDPREPIARTVLATFRSGRRIDSDAVDRAFASAD